MATFQSRPRTAEAVCVSALVGKSNNVPSWAFREAAMGIITINGQGTVEFNGSGLNSSSWLVREDDGQITPVSSAVFLARWEPLPEAIAPEEPI